MAGAVDWMTERHLDRLEKAVQASVAQVRAKAIEQLSARARVTTGALVAAAGGEFMLDDFNVMSADDWADAFGVDPADVVGDIVVDAATAEPLTIGMGVADSVIDDMIARSVGRMRQIGTSVRSSVTRTLQAAVADRLPLSTVVEQLTASSPLSDVAASRMARTTLTTATNQAMLAGWSAASVPFKRWEARDDERTRDSHALADGQVQPIELAFQVGGRAAQFPGDPALPLDELMSCRCSMDRLDGDGKVQAATLPEARREDLYRLAQELEIPGRSNMNKDQLFAAIDRHRSGFGNQRIDQMSKAQLYRRAQLAGLRGRSGLTKDELVGALRQTSFGRDRARYLADTGYSSEEAVSQLRAQLSREATRSGAFAPSVSMSIDLRLSVFARYGGSAVGYVPCIGCGAKLHAASMNPSRHEQMSLLRLSTAIPWGIGNVAPVCASDAAAMSTWKPSRLAKALA